MLPGYPVGFSRLCVQPSVHAMWAGGPHQCRWLPSTDNGAVAHLSGRPRLAGKRSIRMGRRASQPQWRRPRQDGEGPHSGDPVGFSLPSGGVL